MEDCWFINFWLATGCTEAEAEAQRKIEEERRKKEEGERLARETVEAEEKASGRPPAPIDDFQDDDRDDDDFDFLGML